MNGAELANGCILGVGPSHSNYKYKQDTQDTPSMATSDDNDKPTDANDLDEFFASL